MKVLLFSLAVLTTLLHGEQAIEWRFIQSNIDGQKFISNNPLAKGSFFKKPEIKNNCFIINADNYLVLDSIPTSLLNPKSMSLEFIIKLNERASGGEGFFGYFTNGKIKDGFAIGRWDKIMYLTYFDKSGDVTNKAKTLIPENEWLHIITTVSSSKMKIYINGKLLIDEDISLETIFPEQGLFTIGNYFNNADQKVYNMTGAIHLAKMYANVLTKGAVQKKFAEASKIINNNFTYGQKTVTSPKAPEAPEQKKEPVAQELPKQKKESIQEKAVEEPKLEETLSPQESKAALRAKTFRYISLIFFYLGVTFALMNSLQKRGYEKAQLIAAFLTPIAAVLVLLTPKLKAVEEF